MIRVDAHQHFWQLDRGDHATWLTAEIPRIHRDRLPPDLEPLLADARIDKTILIQAAEHVSETEFLLEIAAETPFVAGVVGWVDLESAAGVSDIERLSGDPLLVGVRPMLQDVSDTRWLFRDEVQAAIEMMKAAKLTFDALIRPWHTGALADWAALHPDLSIVIDHAAKPLIAWRQYDGWAEGMRRAAALPNVHCKLSGIVNNAGTEWDAVKLKPYFEMLIGSFGPERLMFGSDWPMIDLAGDYARWIGVCEELTAHLPDRDRELIFGGTAARFYGILGG